MKPPKGIRLREGERWAYDIDSERPDSFDLDPDGIRLHWLTSIIKHPCSSTDRVSATSMMVVVPASSMAAGPLTLSPVRRSPLLARRFNTIANHIANHRTQ